MKIKSNLLVDLSNLSNGGQQVGNLSSVSKSLTIRPNRLGQNNNWRAKGKRSKGTTPWPATHIKRMVITKERVKMMNTDELLDLTDQDLEELELVEEFEVNLANDKGYIKQR